MPAVTTIEYKFRKGIGSTAVWESSWHDIGDLEPFTLYQSPTSYSGYPDKVSDIMFRVNLNADIVNYVQVLYLLSLNCQVVKWSGQGTPTDGARIDEAVYRVDPTISQNRDVLPVARALANIPVGEPANYNTQYWTWQGGSSGLYNANPVYVKLTCIANSGTMGAIAIGNQSFSIENFDITYRNKVPGFNLSPSTVYTGSDLAVTILGRANRTLKLKFRYVYGGIPVTLEDVTVTEDSVSHTCSGTWFVSAGQIDSSIQTASQMTVTVYADILRENGTWDAEVWSDTFTLKAGSDMKPAISTPVITCQQSSPASTHYPDTFLQGISKAKIEFTVTSPVGSTISSVVCLCSNGETISLSYNAGLHKYTGFTSNAVTDGMMFTISAGDARSLISSLTTDPVAAVHYVGPVINVDPNNTYRTNAAGTRTEGGACYKTKATAMIYTDLPNNQIVTFTVKAVLQTNPYTLTSGVQSGNIVTTTAASARMTLTYTLKDYVGYETTNTYYLDGDLVWMYVETAGDGTGMNIGLGKKPATPVTGVSSVDLKVNYGKTPEKMGYLLEGMNAGAFNILVDHESDGSSFGKDFQNIDTSNPISKKNATAYFEMPANSNTWSNAPTDVVSTGWKGIRQVFIWGSNKVLVMVIELQPSVGKMWFTRRNGTTSWSTWTHTANPST